MALLACTASKSAEVQTIGQADSQFPDMQLPYSQRLISGTKRDSSFECKYQSINSNSQEIATMWQFNALSEQYLN